MPEGTVYKVRSLCEDITTYRIFIKVVKEKEVAQLPTETKPTPISPSSAMPHRQLFLAIKAAQRPATLHLALSSTLFASPPIARAPTEFAVSRGAPRSSK